MRAHVIYKIHTENFTIYIKNTTSLLQYLSQNWNI